MLSKSRCDLSFVEYIENIPSSYVLNSWFCYASKFYFAKHYVFCLTSSFKLTLISFENDILLKSHNMCACYHYIYFPSELESQLYNELKSQKVYRQFEIHNP